MGMPKDAGNNSTFSVRQPRHYRDFNLRFGWFDEAKITFKGWVEGLAPGGAMRPDHAVERVYDPLEQRELAKGACRKPRCGLHFGGHALFGPITEEGKLLLRSV